MSDSDWYSAHRPAADTAVATRPTGPRTRPASEELDDRAELMAHRRSRRRARARRLATGAARASPRC